MQGGGVHALDTPPVDRIAQVFYFGNGNYIDVSGEQERWYNLDERGIDSHAATGTKILFDLRDHG